MFDIQIPAAFVENMEAEQARVAKALRDPVALARSHYLAFQGVMSTAERLGHLTRIVESGRATDSEECELLDLLNPAYSWA